MKILIIKSDGIILPHIMNSYESAFIEAGCQVITVKSEEILSRKSIDTISDFLPDIAVCYGISGIAKIQGQGYFLRALKIPLIMLFYDNPFFFMDGELVSEMQEYPQYYYNFIWDDNFLDIFKAIVSQNSFKIMLAADIYKFRPEAKLNLKKSIAFVGSINEGALKSETDNALVDDFINRVIEFKTRHLDIPILNICVRFFKMKKYNEVHEIFQNRNQEFWQRIYFLIHQKGSAFLRKCALAAIDGIDINFYGYTDLSKDNINKCGFASYGQELSRVYQENYINLNVSSLQLETSVNNRVFDVFACKGFVLSDYKRDMDEIFKGYADKISFKNIDDFCKKAEYYFEHEKERNEIIETAYNEILKNHTYKERAKYIVDIFIKNGGKVYDNFRIS